MTLEFKEYQNVLTIKYTIEEDSYSITGNNWLDEKFKLILPFKFQHIFKIDWRYLIESYIDEKTNSKIYYIKIGDIVDEYYKLDKQAFDLVHDVYLDKKIKLDIDLFKLGEKYNLIKNISKLSNEIIRIGESEEDNLPTQEFRKIVNSLPNHREINLYRESVATSILRNYFHNVPDKKNQYENYIKKRRLNNKDYTFELKNQFAETDKVKYKTILEKLKKMLNEDYLYIEKDWEYAILEILLLLFPKYIAYKRQFKFSSANTPDRIPDFLMVDFNGNIDVLEIKKASNISVLGSFNRNNHTPGTDLIKAVMQVEKYIYLLKKDADSLSKKITNSINKDFFIETECKIINPKGLIILGRSKEFDDQQILDFEIIKRQYSNIVDILTFDDLVNRVEKIIKHFTF